MIFTAADWSSQAILGTFTLLSKVNEYAPLGDIYQYTAEQTTKDIKGFANSVHEFFKDAAPNKKVFVKGLTPFKNWK